MKILYNFLQAHYPRASEILRYIIESIYVFIIDQVSRIRIRLTGRNCTRSHGLEKFHFGCGSYILEDHINVDINPAADIRVDLRKKMPFESSVATHAFSEHFIEHLAYPEEVDLFFSEVLRILKSGGEFKISVPDAGMAARMAVNEPEGTYARFSQEYHADWCETDFEHLNYLFRQRTRGMSFLHFECHRFAYDFTTLEKALLRSGFRSVQIRPHEPGLDQDCHMRESLRVTAFK